MTPKHKVIVTCGAVAFAVFVMLTVKAIHSYKDVQIEAQRNRVVLQMTQEETKRLQIVRQAWP